MKSLRTALLALAVLASAGYASDKIQGTVASVLSAIRDRQVGRVYSVRVEIASPPVADDSRFIVRDRTGSVIVRRDLDWPEGVFRAGDVGALSCEIGATASTPAAAYFRSMQLVSRGDANDGVRGNWLVTTKAPRCSSCRSTSPP